MRTIEITVENNRTSELPTRPLSRTTRRDQTDELASSPLDCFCYGWWLCYDFDDPVPPWGCPGGGGGGSCIYTSNCLGLQVELGENLMHMRYSGSLLPYALA